MNRRAGARLAALLAVALLLAGCGPVAPEPAAPEPDRTPSAGDTAVREADSARLQLPTPFEGARLVDPGWEVPPQHADGTFLAAAEKDGVLRFTAVDPHGDVRWRAERPVSCTGFVVTEDARGRAVAVLTDTASTDDALAGTTATAYDLATGEELWGPVDVPGPHQGPGLVFARPSTDPMGEPGPRTVLDPTTGRVAVAEGHRGGDRVIGEHDGTVLLVEGAALVARDTAGGDALWRLGLDDHGWTAGSIQPSTNDPQVAGRALVETSPTTGALLDLRDGTVLDDTARDALDDPVTGTRVTLQESGIQARAPEGRPLWSVSTGRDTTLAAVEDVLLFVREGDAVRVHNAVTGEVAQGYPPDGSGRIVVPTRVAGDGATVVQDGRRYLLAAREGDESGDVPEG
ncbi:hypothetical protein [Isoptericola cucumis]|uniref:hypothetical protein n=1 Tax=Isoptericola cucumis TaxID=1776856 RepID=UPI001668F591|nr:hypothetical protein [Isoptericola cucumis]